MAALTEARNPEGFCVKCHEKREMANAQPVTMKNGRPAIKGVCVSCGTAMFLIGGKA